MTLPTLSDEQSEHHRSATRSERAYAIVRVDDFLGVDAPIEHRIAIKKVMGDADAAEREVERLNRLQKAPGVRYFSQITRIDRPGGPHQGHAENRIGRIYASAPGQANSQDVLANSQWLETIIVREFIWQPYPKGLDFPISRVLEVCAHSDDRHQVTWSPIELFILVKNGDDYVDVVGLQPQGNTNIVSFAFRIFSDMLSIPLRDLSPLALVRAIAEKYGVNVQVNGESGRFFLERSIDIPGTSAGSPIPTEIFKVEHDNQSSGISLFTFCFVPPVVRIALGFALDTTKFMEARKNR
jgi:hypothetical protein